MTSLVTDSLTGLVEGVREVTRRPSNWQQTADRAAAALARHLPSGADVLRRLPAAASDTSDADQVRSNVLHVEPDSSFSIVALILRPGQQTVIHDHVTWCAVAMIQGLEREELFTLDVASDLLIPTRSTTGRPGEISAFAPPGDIHRVSNIGTDLSISINVYGTDVSRIGSSVRQTYFNPIGPLPTDH
jgi:predicted metal-dependent enzyme (double-stranded beta helix superfamily)